MKIVLINNRTKHLTALCSLLDEHELEIIQNEDLGTTQIDGDLIISSGSSGRGVMKHKDDYYLPQIELIRTTTLPFLGICLGAQLFTVANGGSLVREQEKIERESEMIVEIGDDVIPKGTYCVHELHRWSLDLTHANSLRILGNSAEGDALAVRHKQELQYGFVFHPEVGVNDGRTLLYQFLDQVKKRGV